ncbi:hypothetical protein OXX69_003098 [Metschnikowia pulcherrima]
MHAHVRATTWKMKRTTDKDVPASKLQKHDNAYKGYVVQAGDQIQSVKEKKAFRKDFLDARKPAKLTCKPPVAIKKFRLESIVRTLNYDRLLQVERKVNYGFGSGQKKELLTLKEIVDRLKSGDDSYYLTTQYEKLEDDEESLGPSDEDDSDDDDSDDDGAFDPSQIDIEALKAAIKKNDADIARFEKGDFSKESEDEDEQIMAEEEETRAISDAVWRGEEGGIPMYEVYDEIKTLFQPPLLNLSKVSWFPIVPAPFENLVPQQINLWMGSSVVSGQKPDLLHPTKESLGNYVPEGNSSGLHHDHADNLYVLTQGRKRFTLYSPKDAAKLYTVGNINKVYENGLIDYQVDEKAPLWKPMREDGAIISQWAEWALENVSKEEYSDETLEGMIENEPKYTGKKDDTLDPPSFSRVPPILAHLDEVTDPEAKKSLEEFADREFPGFRDLNKLEVWLEPGEMLYVPTGWFHEVTSYSSGEDSAHIALNWWFMPPSQGVANPYKDDYWDYHFGGPKEAVMITRDRAEKLKKYGSL